LKEALRLKQDYPEAHYGLGLCRTEKGDLVGAIQGYQAALRYKKDYPEAYYNLGNARKAKGDVDGAIKAYQEALRYKKDLPDAQVNLGIALEKKGEAGEAIACFQKALELAPKHAQAHGALGDALLRSGRFAQAQTTTKRALDLLPHGHPLRPLVTLQLQRCERLVELDARLQDILNNKVQPADAAERVTLAQVCHLKRLYRQEARFYEEAFADQPSLANDLKQPHRYNAACAATLAGCGQGKDVDHADDKERSRLRQQALQWLQADLAAYQRLLKREPDKLRPVIAQQLQHWLKDTDFAGVRGPEALAKLPKDERQAWQQLWADVADTLARVKAQAAPEKKPPNC
jgi:tetratricopeptide (TPR) repeat protein